MTSLEYKLKIMNNSALLLAAVEVYLPQAKKDYANLLGNCRYPALSQRERQRCDKLAEFIALGDEAMRHIKPPPGTDLPVEVA